MLGITLSAKRNFYPCQCLDNVEMYTYAKFDQIISSGYKVMSIQLRQNHRQRMDSTAAAEATGGLDALLRQICALDSAGFLLKNTNVLSSNRGFLIYAKHYHRGTNYQ